MPQIHRLTACALAALVATTLAACSGGGSGNPVGKAVSLPPGLTSAAAKLPAAGGATASAGAVSQTRMRIVNLFAPKGKPTLALDIYDVQLTGQKATPIAAKVAYGSASPYFSPRVEPNTSIVQLYALPAGADPVADKADAKNMGGAQDDGSHPQITWRLTADQNDAEEMPGPLAGLSFSDIVEKGTDNGAKAPVAPAAPSGQGELLADTSAILDPNLGVYLMIDDSCAPALNGVTSQGQVPYVFAVDGKAPVSNFALFATAPGSHQVSVVSWPSGTPPTCAQLTAKQGATSVEVTAGQQVEAYIYGTSTTDLHIALAPIQQ
jgi:hypothetical protein